MDSWTKDQLLAFQQQNSGYGTVVYEHGIQVMEKSGWIITGNGSIVVYGDNAMLADEQQRFVIPNQRIIELRMDARPSL